MAVGDVEHNYLEKYLEAGQAIGARVLETNPEDADIILMGLLPEKARGMEGWTCIPRTPYGND